MRTLEVACGLADSASAVRSVIKGSSADGLSPDLILGGQNNFVKLTSSSVTYAGAVFSFNATIHNLIGQALGTTDSVTLHASGVRVFFVSEPSATSGSGTIDFVNPVGGGSLIDGRATFTTSNQAYYQYNEIIRPNQTSAPRTWRLHVPASVSSFEFFVYVSAPMQYPSGWIDVLPHSTMLTAGSATGLSATVRDQLGRVQTGGVVTWASSNPAVASVHPNTGVVSAIGAGSATITATSSSRVGTATLAVSALSQIALPQGTQGSAYSTALAAPGGMGAVTWGLAGGALPSGLSLSAGGAIDGIPTASGEFAFTVKASSGTQIIAKAFTLQINGAQLLVGTASLADGSTTPVRIEILQPTGGAVINSAATTWIVIHGRCNSSTTTEIQELARAIRTKRGSDQVLLLDWETAAGPCPLSDGENWIEAVGQWAAMRLTQYGFVGTRLNLIGHSWGTYVADELATNISGGVNVIVALDPAANDLTSGAFNPNDAGEIDFAAHSRFSIAFHSSNAFGNEDTPATADEAFSVGFWQTVGNVNEVARHSWIRDMFTAMVLGTGGVSRLFTLDGLLAHTAGPWQSDRYEADAAYYPTVKLPKHRYEAIIEGVQDYRTPRHVRYFDRSSGNEVTLQEVPTVGAVVSTLRGVDGSNSAPSRTEQWLYTTPPTTLSGSNPTTFSNVPTGTYLLEGYHTETFWGREFWTSKQVTVNNNQTTNATLTRNYPYAVSAVIKNNSTGAVISAGQSVPTGTVLRAEVTVRNDVISTNMGTTVRFVVDRSQGGSYDFDQTAAAQTIGGSGGTKLYTFIFIPSATSQYYFSLAVNTTIGANSVMTDSWAWTNAFITGTAPAAPTLVSPANGTLYAAGTTSTTLTWSLVSAATAGYNVEVYRGSCGGTPENGASIVAPRTSFAVNGLSNGRDYYWQVQSVGAGLSAFSNCFAFSVNLAGPALSAPLNGATGQSRTPTFRWANVTGNVGYRILVATSQSALPRSASSGSCSGCVINTTTATSATTYTPASGVLAAGTTYYWEVHALSGGTVLYFGDWSSIASFKTQ